MYYNNSNNEEWFKLANNEAETMCARPTGHSCALEVVLFYYLTIGSLYMYIPFCSLRHVVVDADGLA